MNPRVRVARRILSHQLSESATLIRETEGSRNMYGEFVPGVITETPVTVVTVPVDGEERLILPEGLREEDLRKFYLRHDIEVLDDDHAGDKIRYLSKEYRMMVAEDWGEGYTEAVGKYPSS
ncbi:MAG: hypothetical protein F4X63_08175 [Nitrospira sp. SB0662_bin_26]|nr:hypothetical protein [Nitrospira sp. SB0662_bin_26]